MRQGFRDVGFTHLNQANGFCLGWDFTAEHEGGIASIQTAFGVPGMPKRRPGGDLVGADARTVTRIPERELRFFDRSKHAYLLFSSAFVWHKPPPNTAKELDRLMRCYGKDDEAVAGWSERDLGIRVPHADRERLRAISDALLRKDAMIFLAGSANPFARRGLYVVVRSSVSAEMLEQMREADCDYLALEEAVEKTGIRERLELTGKRYYALKPRWLSAADTERVTTMLPVIFFLNPCDQDKNNHGWFTVEQLDQWIAGEGPIPKKG